jgi:hypothetical protein
MYYRILCILFSQILFSLLQLAPLPHIEWYGTASLSRTRGPLHGKQ